METDLKRGSYLEYPYYKGLKIDRITILEDNFVKHQDRYMVKFQCDCGYIDYKRLSLIGKMQCVCCRKCSRRNDYPELRKMRHIFDDNGLHYLWLSLIKQNLIRGNKEIKCNITMQDLFDILVTLSFKCKYTGEQLNVINITKDKSNASIDRIDSNKDYTRDNILWVFKPINIMKNLFTDKMFKELCYKVNDFTRQS